MDPIIRYGSYLRYTHQTTSCLRSQTLNIPNPTVIHLSHCSQKARMTESYERKGVAKAQVGNSYSAKSQPWSADQGSLRPRRLKPSEGLLSALIHSHQTLVPSVWSITWENWQMVWTSGCWLEPRMREATAASLSTNHSTSLAERTAWWIHGTNKPHNDSPGKICWFRGTQLSKTSWGTAQVPPHWGTGTIEKDPSQTQLIILKGSIWVHYYSISHLSTDIDITRCSVVSNELQQPEDLDVISR